MASSTEDGEEDRARRLQATLIAIRERARRLHVDVINLYKGFLSNRKSWQEVIITGQYSFSKP